MKKGIVALLSALVLALTFAGCSESDGSFSSSGDSTVTGDVDIVGVTDVSKAVNEFGLDPVLGTPPALPAE